MDDKAVSDAAWEIRQAWSILTREETEASLTRDNLVLRARAEWDELKQRVERAEAEIADREVRWASDLDKASREINRATEADHALLRREIADLTARLAVAEADARIAQYVLRNVAGLDFVEHLALIRIPASVGFNFGNPRESFDAAIAQEAKNGS